MKRIAGTFMLLAGLSGCISFTGLPGQGDKKTSEVKSTPPASSAPVANAVPPGVPMPSPQSWATDPGQIRSGSTVGSTSARLSTPATPPPPAPAAPAAPASSYGALPANMLSLVPVVTTPPAANRGPSLVSGTMPVVVTPRGEQTGVQPITYTTRQDDREPKVFTPKGAIPMPPVPSVKGSQSSETRVAKNGAPLMRMVNTKRITLNFEVKDVGASGLASVELWYTQDGKEWKKYDAPTQAKAYVVEVDEEGMYGFTLLARSGLGLGKEPPAPGDQPQVWVIVDLTKPDVRLTDVTPNITSKVQQISFKWQVSDKNLGRQPISLYYADKEDGPWKVIATNLENTGRYTWQVPADAPPRFIVRAEAIDLAGNVGTAQSSKPILLDNRVPSVSIVNVEANASH